MADADLQRLVQAFREHERRVFGTCFAYLHDVAAAEDATQETFIRASRRLGEVGERSAGRYLLFIARNVCIDEMRRRHADGRARDNLRAVAVHLDPEVDAVDRHLVSTTWGQLSERERALFLYRFAGYSYGEIAGRLRMSPDAVGMALLRARQRARRLLGRLSGLLVLLPRRWTRRPGRAAVSERARGAWAAARMVRHLAGLATRTVLVITVGTAAGAVLVLARPFSAPPAPAPPVSVAPLSRESAMDTTVVTAIAVSPMFARDHVLVASGHSARGCAAATCPVLLRSQDGGHTWQQLPAAGFSGGRVLLSPAYPGDATIFAAGPDGLQSSDDGGRSFRTLARIPGPVDIAPGSSAGHLRIAIGSQTLWFYDVSTGRLQIGPALPVQVADVTGVRWVDGGDVQVVADAVTMTHPDQRTAVVARCDHVRCRAVSANGVPSSPLPAAFSAVVTLPGGRTMALLAEPDAQGRWGVRCSDAGGARWGAC